MQIPIVDLADLGLQTTEGDIRRETEERVGRELDSAFSTVGFVYLKNHGIEDQVVRRVFDVSAQFFKLPVDVKERYKRTAGNNNGYLSPGLEILHESNIHEIRETYDIHYTEGTLPDAEVPEMRSAISEMFDKANELNMRLLTVMALTLGLDRDFFTSLHKGIGKGVTHNATGFRTLYYPPLGDSPVEAGVVRCGEHSDYGTLTLLFQDDMGGLEVISEGKWIPANPIPGAILVNVGDLLQFWTSDRYLATVHRVRIPEEEIRRRSPRQSVAFFVHPDNDVMVSPLDGSGKRPPVSALDYLKEKLSATYKF